MKDHPTHHPKDIRYDYEREDAFQQSALNVSKTRHTKRRRESVNSNNESNFSYLNMIRLNKGKQFLLAEERNTEIQRSNRILHQKLARCATKARPNSLKSSQMSSINRMETQQLRSKSKSKNKSQSKKIKTIPTLPVLEHDQSAHGQRIKYNSVSKSRARGAAMTLFMGHSIIDEVQFKIKIVISEQIYYLIAQNQHTKIVLEMPEEEYWALHYQEFEENPCNIFKYLQIEKGQISFRVQNRARKDKLQQMFGGLPKGIEKRKASMKSNQKLQKLPRI